MAPSPCPSPPEGARELNLVFSCPLPSFGGEGARRAGEGEPEQKRFSPLWKGFPRLVLLVFLLLPSNLLSQAMTPEVHQIGDRLACQCGNCNNQVSTCPMLNCHSATPLREEIAGMIKQGMNPEQIVKAFVAKYGKVILAAPPAEGFDMMAWTLPFIMLLLGFIVVYRLIKTWLNRKPLLAPSVGGPGTIPESYQDRIDRELKDLDI